MPIVICISLFSARPRHFRAPGVPLGRRDSGRCLAYLGCRAAAPGIAWEPVPHNTRQKSEPVKESAEKVVKDIRRATRRHFSAEDKIRIVVEGLRGEESIALPP
jgi:hypothetical protein